jgi:integrase/recombinase XerD
MAIYSEMTLYGSSGQRLYLNPAERRLFAQAAITQSVSNEARTFCRLVYYTGCRISEALQLTSDRVDTANGCVIFRTLKKGKSKTTGQPIVKFRSVPVPERFIDELNLVHKV